MKSTPAGRPPSLLERGRWLCDTNRVEEAMSAFAAAAAQAPDDPEAWCLLALAALRLRDHRAALEHAECALRCAPASDWAHRLRALALLFLKRVPEAYEAATAAVRLAPDEPETLTVLGWAAFERRRLEEAAILGRRLMQVAPQSADGPALAAQVAEIRCERGRAIALYEEALRLDPRKSSALEGLARLRGQGARNDERAEILGMVLRERPTERARQEQLASALSDLAFDGTLGARHRSIGSAFAALFWLFVALGVVLFSSGDALSRPVRDALELAYLVSLPLLVVGLYPILQRRFVGRLPGGLAAAFDPLVARQIRDRAKLWGGVLLGLAAVLPFVPALRRDPLAALWVVLVIVLLLAWGILAFFAVRSTWFWLRDAVALAWRALLGGEQAAANRNLLALVAALGAGTAAALVLLVLPLDPLPAQAIGLLWLFGGPLLAARLIQRAPLPAATTLALLAGPVAIALFTVSESAARGAIASAFGVMSLLGWIALPLALRDRLRLLRERRRMAVLLG